MLHSHIEELRNQIRGITGALLVVGLSFHYTMETWFLGWTLPLLYLVGYALVGLALVLLITRNIGFRKEAQRPGGKTRSWVRILTDFSQILLQSFIASYLILLILGIIDVGSSLNLIMRLGLIEVVPLGFGAALANDLFGSTSEQETKKERHFPKNIAIFAIGALFVSAPIAPTDEMELIAAHMGWGRHMLLIVLTLVLIYLILFELGFKGQQARVQQDKLFQIGTAFVVYTIGTTTAFLLLIGMGHFIDATAAFTYQETVVLAFPASLGAAAAEVVI